jgi:exodeoxyribonuclease VII large subunit
MPKTLTLKDLNDEIGKVLHTAFNSAIWVSAEINQISLNRNGHCYLELVEKCTTTDKITAQARGTIWGNTYRLLKPFFEQSTGQLLRSGLKILVKAQVHFHALYGLSLNITDIDPSYTLGDLAMRRKEIIQQLESTGMMDMNRNIDIPLAIKRIAIISSKSAAGYDDFTNELKNNSFKYAFKCSLFEATMQGEKTESTITSALNKIFEQQNQFDVVLILRGGGSKTDLSAFDNYEIAAHIMQFPLPVFTGIGHERDESIADLVANKSLKTPTAAAEFIIAHNNEFEQYAIDLYGNIVSITQNLIYENKSLIKNFSVKIAFRTKESLKKQNQSINQLSQQFITRNKQYIQNTNNNLNKQIFKLRTLTPVIINKQKQKVNNLQHWLGNAPASMLRHKKQELEKYSQLMHLADPINILKRGYSITTINGKSIKSVKDIPIKAQIKTQLVDGILTSIVEKK